MPMSIAAVPRDVHAPVLPRRHPITVAEYFRMGETGVLDPEARIELIEGDLIDMPPIGAPHAGKTNRLTRLLVQAVGERAILSTQNPIVLGLRSAPQPDLVLLRHRDDWYETEHPGPQDCLLLIEVADTSLTHDRKRKLPLYARFGIPEVWIIDLRGRRLDSYQAPDAGRYTRQVRITDLSRVGIAAFPDLSLDLSGLF
jgi:Uma2 family endonuclease